MRVKFKKLHIDAKTPEYATPGSNGMDLVAVTKNKVYDKDNGNLMYIEYGTGIAVELPKGCCALVLPRSSVANTSLMLSNSCGLIDNDFRGEITFRFRTNFATIREYGLGDRLGQMIILPVPKITLVEVSDLSDTERGEGGYGSTGEEYLGG